MRRLLSLVTAACLAIYAGATCAANDLADGQFPEVSDIDTGAGDVNPESLADADDDGAYPADDSDAPYMSDATVDYYKDMLESFGWGVDMEQSEHKAIYDEIAKLQQEMEENYKALVANADAMHKKEQSTANKIIGAVGIGATGLGAMQAASALAEQRADQDADADMRAYLATFTCDYGRGRNIRGGETSLELPGGNDMIDLYAEYAALAQSLAVRKSQLDLAPGIEAEVVIDKADTKLYDNGAIGKTDGAYASLARAIMDENGADAQKIAEIKDATAKKLKTGAIMAGVGAIGSLTANLIANRNAPKENSAALLRQREGIITKLRTLIDQEVERCNTQISNAKEFAAKIKADPVLMADEDMAQFVAQTEKQTPLAQEDELLQVKERILCY